MKKWNYNSVKEYIESNDGCELISKEYVNYSSKLEIKCKCGNVFLLSFNGFKNKNKHTCNACSKKGERNPNWKGGKISFKCEQCGKLTYQKKYDYNKHKHHYCSRECKDKWQIGNLRGANHPGYKKEEHENYICEQCGKVFNGLKCQNNTKHHYCSRECKWEWQKENTKGINSPRYGTKLSEYTKLKISNTRKVRCKNGSITPWNKGKKLGDKYCGINHPRYNPNLTDEERETKRRYPGYEEYRNKVFERDNHTCQCCKDNTGGNLNSHHIYGYTEHIKTRLDINYSITLCECCHKEYHKIYGYKNINWSNFKKFLNQKYVETNDKYFLELINNIEKRIKESERELI